MQPVSVYRGPIGLIMLGVVIWTIVLAGGVLLYDYREGQVNWLKPLIIVVCSSLFLTLWALALRRVKVPE
jgi:hypothetical protein